ncbi:FAD-dependent monooxygenase [Patulibacter brassicae]|uniref:FAD-dependent monooxygenase n=1 Tax=Patulibacter brassicae TaxID=1705717 RepID=A0ABU4VEB1_9ACTN|nr:FAD-dependent monooxygenase [Patulibacter brassicae]MDX8150141.1 FAD-dependent monooxygenase [Patulibacter brassicae]
MVNVTKGASGRGAAAGEHAMVIAGAGPTGVMLAAELALAGVDAVVVERRTADEHLGSRSGGLLARTIEILDQRGIAERVLAAGSPVQVHSYGTTTLDLAGFPTRHPYALALWQNRFEELLGTWADELGVRVLRGRAIAAIAQDADGVTIDLDDGARLRAAYLVGCDGGRSLVRKAAGIGFPGWDAATSYLLAEVAFDEEPEVGLRRDARGVYAIGPAEDGHRVVAREDVVEAGDAPTLEELRDALRRLWGRDFGLRQASSLSRFRDTTRLASTYRSGRVLLAGDAAHIHAPMGGQGLQLGLQDAVNLGWKLAQVLDGVSPTSLLDTYDAERRPVAARAQRHTMALTALARGDDRTAALREVVDELLELDEARTRLAGALSGLDVHYDLGDGHPLLGRRVPDLDLATDDGPRRTSELLHDARPLLLDLGRGAPLDAADVPERVRVVRARAAGPWELPVLGAVAAPTGLLVRPDGYVAWVGGDGRATGLPDALARWCGAPA